MKYKNLFQPIQINKLQLSNRIVVAPISGQKLPPEIYRSKGAITVMGSVSVEDPCGLFFVGANEFAKENRQETRHLLNYMKQGGSYISAQLIHMGRWSRSGIAIGPIDETNPEGYPVRAATEDDLQRVTRAYAKTAEDAKNFGFDMIMLHFAHGWLIPQFLSPAWNKRQDQYGGAYENRARFPLQVVKAVREAVGRDFPIDMRISACEWIENGISFDDVLHFISDCEPYIDMVNISAGTDMNKKGSIHMATTQLEDHMTNVTFATQVKSTVNIPVAVVGAIMTPDEAEQIIHEGKADLVTLGRAMLADPNWIRKAMEGREDDIVPCLRCTYCFHWTTDRHNQYCSVNMRYLRDPYIPQTPTPAQQRKKVIVIGGGPAGMMAAWSAHRKGHGVTLFEQSDHLGGQTNCSKYSAHKQDLLRYRNYLVRQIEKSGLHVEKCRTATPEMIKNLAPDVLFLALGAKPVIPPIPGSKFAMLAVDAYPVLNDLPKQIVIIGGGTVGCELALDLDDGVRQITVIELSDRLHKQDNKAYDMALDEHLSASANISCLTETSCNCISKDHVIIKTKSGDTGHIQADQVILATGFTPLSEEAAQFFGIALETHIIGDCRNIGKVRDANEQGFLFANHI